MVRFFVKSDGLFSYYSGLERTRSVLDHAERTHYGRAGVLNAKIFARAFGDNLRISQSDR